MEKKEEVENTQQEETIEGAENADNQADEQIQDLESQAKGMDSKELKNSMKKILESLGKNPKGDPNKMKYLQNLAPLWDDHAFWDTQPVPKAWEMKEPQEGEIEKKEVKDVKDTPYNLPEGFTWSEIDVKDKDQIEEVYKLLTFNYVEDDDHMFRFDYSVNFLQWALCPPNYHKQWHIGVRGGKKNALFAFISGIPVKGTSKKMAEINFLCVHNKLRKHRLAPVLIKEITRRVNLLNIWQAVYTAGIVIPKPISTATYWHRSLNPKKLIDVGFSSCPQNRTLAQHVKILKTPKEAITLKNLSEMTKKDVKGVHTLLMNYLKKFQLYTEFSQDEVSHFFIPRDDVIYTYVNKNDAGEIMDIVSFYSLPSTILNNDKHNVLRAAYGYYNVCTTAGVTFRQLLKDALILANKAGFDVFNALDVMDNDHTFKDLQFGVGNGNLHYYLYNWRINQNLEPKDVGIILV